MKYSYLLILTFISTIAFSQDVYPFFSDPVNQLEFEKKRIYIKEFEEERQLISGGGNEFNPLWLFFSNAPMFKATPIQTSFYYDYTFEIMENGVVLNEIEFLQFIGLNDLANTIITDYKNKFVHYQGVFDKWNNNQYYIEEKSNVALITGGILLTGMGLFGVINQDKYDTVGYGLGYMGLGALVTIAGIIKPLKIKHEYPKPLEPVLKQHLTNDQIKAIAESHNRKVYSEIL